jgi:hypothetical protein
VNAGWATAPIDYLLPRDSVVTLNVRRGPDRRSKETRLITIPDTGTATVTLLGMPTSSRADNRSAGQRASAGQLASAGQSGGQ